MNSTVGRGGHKLAAALVRFELQEKLRGVRAIDLGASTGGFTEQILLHGASHVVAVDVGHGQLHSRLRTDPRVESLEHTHWKTLSLKVAPGPYDFFTIDVSFIAARSMLRGLAFRLREDAEGVVLLKPQFELSDRALARGVEHPAVRQQALEKFGDKANALGFEVMETFDSPVAGGSGTVELLVHLRFRGRPDRLPRPGERRGHLVVKASGGTEGRFEKVSFFAVAAPGLEPLVEKELVALPEVKNPRAVPGGVEFEGDLPALYAANLWLRTATRVLARIGTVEAREFSRLRRRAAALTWERFLPDGAEVEWSVSQSRSRLYHTGAIAENLIEAVADRIGRPAGAGTTAPFRLLARGVEDRFTLSVDTSGELLHRRGWRKEGAEAPLRETLAAALLFHAEWQPETPFFDPMCGSGTLPLEACAIALRRAPGRGRSFAFERFRNFDAHVWGALKAEAAAREHQSPPAFVGGSDASTQAIEAARRNAERADLLPHVQLSKGDFREIPAPSASGLLLVNPPYGRRLGEERQLVSLYRDLGRLIRSRYMGWRVGVLYSNRRFVAALGLRAEKELSISNGGVPVTFALFPAL